MNKINKINLAVWCIVLTNFVALHIKLTKDTKFSLQAHSEGVPNYFELFQTLHFLINYLNFSENCKFQANISVFGGKILA